MFVWLVVCMFILFCEVCSGIEIGMKNLRLILFMIIFIQNSFWEGNILSKFNSQGKYCIQNKEVIFLFFFLSLCTFYSMQTKNNNYLRKWIQIDEINLCEDERLSEWKTGGGYCELRSQLERYLYKVRLLCL